jgi:hypothetical protein
MRLATFGSSVVPKLANRMYFDHVACLCTIVPGSKYMRLATLDTTDVLKVGIWMYIVVTVLPRRCSLEDSTVCL